MTGFCSKCHKVWTAEAVQAVCQWCGKQATCLSSDTGRRPGFLKAIRRRRKQKQVYDDSQAYNELPDRWGMYAQVAEVMKRKVPDQDRGDMKHDIIVRLVNRDVNTKSLAYVVAKEAIVDYWRHERYRQVDSLDWEIIDTEGNTVRLVDTLQAHEKDFEQLDFARELLANMPVRLIKVATKKIAGYPMTRTEYEYLRRYRKDQKQLRLKLEYEGKGVDSRSSVGI